MNVLFLILIGVVGIVLGMYFASRRSVADFAAKQSNKKFVPKEKEELIEMQEDAREALSARTEKRKDKILYLLNNEATHQEELKACGVDDIKKGITSRNVEKLLDVSNATARKYLNELEDENKVKQIGKAGRDVYYTLNA